MNISTDTPLTEPLEIEIRHCESLAEYETCVQLQFQVWGEQIAVPSPIFVVAHHTGGQILGAYDGEKMVGFTLALAGTRAGKPFLHSHMTAVLPEYQNQGVGRRLKLFQRHDALKRDIRLVEWTFDPLELKNAHFNFVRLGAIARRFIPNCYGVTEQPAARRTCPPTASSPNGGLIPTASKISSPIIRLPAATDLQSISLPANLNRSQSDPTAPPLSACNPTPEPSSRNFSTRATSPPASSPAAPPPTTFWNQPLP